MKFCGADAKLRGTKVKIISFQELNVQRVEKDGSKRQNYMLKKPQILREILNKELPEVNYAYHKVISYSQFSMFQGCPHKWALQYRDGHYDESPSIHFTFGTAMHETIQGWLTTMYEESGAKADSIDLEETFRDRFISLYQEEYKKNYRLG